MTSVFEVLSNKEIWQNEAKANTTIQNMHQVGLDYIKHEEKLSTVRSTTQRYFMICQTCFWCASYIGIMGMNELPFENCLICNDNKVESLPILCDESYRYEYTSTGGVVLEFLRSWALIFLRSHKPVASIPYTLINQQICYNSLRFYETLKKQL